MLKITVSVNIRPTFKFIFANVNYIRHLFIYWLAWRKVYGFCLEVYTDVSTDWLTFRHQIVLNLGLFILHHLF